MNALEIVWTVLALFGLVTTLINLADAWADNVTLQDETRDGLADLQSAGNVIAVDNVGREVLVILGLLSCLTIGIVALTAPPPPPTTTPEQQQSRSLVGLLVPVCLITIEVCLVLISVLGRVRRISVRRMLQMAIRARVDAASASERSEIATAVVSQAGVALAPEQQQQHDQERQEHREDHRQEREERAERQDQENTPTPKPYGVPPPGTIPQAGEPEKTNQ